MNANACEPFARGAGRVVAALVAVAIGAAGLTACGNSSSTTDAAANPADPAAFPPHPRHRHGSGDHPEVPHRIVVLDTVVSRTT